MSNQHLTFLDVYYNYTIYTNSDNYYHFLFYDLFLKGCPQSLRDLYLTIKERYFITEDRLSNSLTILGLLIRLLGVCNEIVGAKEAADQFSDTTLQNEYYICPTAAKRKVNLNMK